MTPTIAELAVSPEELDRAVEAMRVAPFAGTEGYHWSQIWDLCEQLKFPCAGELMQRLLGELSAHLDALDDLDKMRDWMPVEAKE